MLSSKLQDDLITAYQKVYEEKRGHAAGSDDTEKQASQLASDVRYKAKGKVPEGASEEEKRKIYLQILGASPAPNVVKAMAKEKLLGEEVVNERLGLQQIAKLGKKAGKLDRRMGTKAFAKDKAKFKQGVKDAVFGKTTAGKVTRIAAGGTAAYMMGRKDESGANVDRNLRLGSLKKAGYTPVTKIKPLSSDSVKYEEVVHEMRFDDGKEGKEKRKETLRKKRGMTKAQMDKHPQFKEDVKEGLMKKPSNLKKALGKLKNQKVTPPEVKKDMEDKNKKFGVTSEGTAYGIYKGDGVMKIGKKEEEKAPRKQKGAMAYDGPNKERSEAADRVLAKAKKKREKMKEDYVGEMKMKSKPKNPKDMSKGVEQKAPVDYRTLAQSYAPVGNIFNEKKLDAVGAEDKDIDNDGDHDSTDKYLLKRRKAIGKAIAKKRGRVKEGFSAWRIDLDFNEQVKK